MEELLKQLDRIEQFEFVKDGLRGDIISDKVKDIESAYMSGRRNAIQEMREILNEAIGRR